MFNRKKVDPTNEAILDLLRKQQEAASNTVGGNSLYSFKNLNALAIAAIIGLGAFIWTGVTEQPQKNAAQFSTLSTQSAEIRTTALETKSAVISLNAKFDAIQKDQSETKSLVDKNAAQIESLGQQVKNNAERIGQLERDTR